MTSNDFVKEWIKKVDHDLGTAKLIVENGVEYTDQVCYHSQQAVEKIFKAVLAKQGKEIPKTHNLSILIDLVAPFVKIDPTFYDIADILDSYSVDVRYPMGDFEPTQEEAVEAFEKACSIVVYIKAVLNK